MKTRISTRILAVLLLAAVVIGLIPSVVATDSEEPVAGEQEGSTEETVSESDEPLSEDGETLTRTPIIPRARAATGTMTKTWCVDFADYYSPTWYCNRYHTGVGHSYGHYFYASTMSYHYIDGELAYCLEPNTLSYSNQAYTSYDNGSAATDSYWMLELDATQRELIKTVLAFSYPEVDYGYGEQAQYAATQVILWEIIMRHRYEIGIVSPDFFAQTYSASGGNDAVSGTGAGIWMTAINGIVNLSAIEPDSDIQPIANPVLNHGDPIRMEDSKTSPIDNGGCIVSGNCPDVELACRLLDYGYSSDSILLQNFGVEGEAFAYDPEGQPVLTELVTDNPEYAFSIALLKYTSATPFSVSDSKRDIYGYTDAQVKALTVWAATGDRIVAPGMLWEMDNQTEYLTLCADMDSYVSTQCLKFITGEEPLDQWDSFVNTVVDQFEIERITELLLEAADNYKNRTV